MSCIADTLRDIAEESSLHPNERYSLREIAKEYEKLEAKIEQLQTEIEKLREALKALKGLTHYHYTILHIDDQSEDKIAEFIDQALKEK